MQYLSFFSNCFLHFVTKTHLIIKLLKMFSFISCVMIYVRADKALLLFARLSLNLAQMFFGLENLHLKYEIKLTAFITKPFANQSVAMST